MPDRLSSHAWKMPERRSQEYSTVQYEHAIFFLWMVDDVMVYIQYDILLTHASYRREAFKGVTTTVSVSVSVSARTCQARLGQSPSIT